MKNGFYHFWPNSGLTPRWSFLKLTGKDAFDLIHRLSTVDIHQLPLGEESPGFFLSPQGKVRAYFRVRKIDPSTLGFEFDPGPHQEWRHSLMDFVSFYTFQEKIHWEDSLQSHPETVPCWIFGNNPDLLPEEWSSYSEMDTFFHGTHDFGRPWWSIWGPSSVIQKKLEALPSELISSHQALTDWRVHALTPHIDVEIRLDSNPLELGLGNAITDQKGCYPGQEVIEKIVSLGAPAQRLCRVTSDEPMQTGDTLQAPQSPSPPIGTLTQIGAHGQALALIKKTHARPGQILQSSSGALIRIEQLSGYELAARPSESKSKST